MKTKRMKVIISLLVFAFIISVGYNIRTYFQLEHYKKTVALMENESLKNQQQILKLSKLSLSLNERMAVIKSELSELEEDEY